MRSRHAALVAVATVLSPCLSGAAAGASNRDATIPLLAPAPYLSIDTDLPAPVRARLEREQKALMEQARAAAQEPATGANGCEPYDSSKRSFGAPAPTINARILGHHVEVVFSYARMPSSPGCRPWELIAVVYSRSPTFKNSVGHYWIRGPRGRIVLDLPWSGRPPYRVSVRSSTISGRQGPEVERALRCPRTGDVARGCLLGYRPAPHSYPMPKPVLPLRGLDRSTLERSLAYALAGERAPPIFQAVPRSSQCPSLETCVVTYVDPAFPDSPYRVRYRIAGEQIRGCWMGLKQGVLDPLPFSDASTGRRLQLAACASWLR